MKQKFEVILLEDVWKLLDELDQKIKDKILYNLDKSKFVNDPKLLKKLDNDIWEFRTKYRRLHYRLLAFGDKSDRSETLVVSTHGIIKKTDKIPKNEIEKARKIMKNSNKLKIYTLDQAKDKYIGKIGDEKRDKYEYELKLDILGEMIKQARKERHLTQSELGKLIGVQKSQISRLERNTKNVTLETILRVFKALKAKVNFNVELLDGDIRIA